MSHEKRSKALDRTQPVIRGFAPHIAQSILDTDEPVAEVRVVTETLAELCEPHYRRDLSIAKILPPEHERADCVLLSAEQHEFAANLVAPERVANLARDECDCQAATIRDVTKREPSFTVIGARLAQEHAASKSLDPTEVLREYEACVLDDAPPMAITPILECFYQCTNQEIV